MAGWCERSSRAGSSRAYNRRGANRSSRSNRLTPTSVLPASRERIKEGVERSAAVERTPGLIRGIERFEQVENHSL